MKPPISRPCAVLAFFALALLAPAQAQNYDLVEDFENNGTTANNQVGPPNLTAAGWIFRNQSDPGGGTPAWLDSFGPPGPNTGSGYLSTILPAPHEMELSNWAILPSVTGQDAGDVLTFWKSGGALLPWPIVLEVRYSASGGTDTGSGPSAVGDFDQLLFDELLPLSSSYSQVQVQLPGSGRVALRFACPQIGFHLQSTATLLIDTLTIGDAPGAPCGLVLPEPGETVVWDAAGSPYTVCQDLVIPTGGRLVVGPGATLEFEAGKRLEIEGELELVGTDADPVVVANGGVSSFLVPGGSVRVEHADVASSFVLLAGSSFHAVDSLFREDVRFAPAWAGSFVHLERCEVRSEWIEFNGTTVLDDVQFTNAAAQLASVRGFWRIQSLESSTPLEFTASAQDRLIDHVTITGVTWAPALELRAHETVVDFRLGEGNVLLGNQYPVWARDVGLHRSSSLPVVGNLRDAIRGPEDARAHLRSRLTLPDLGLPYDFEGTSFIKGRLKVDPGTRFAMGPQAKIQMGGDSSRDTILRGLPGAPLVFESRIPGQQWGGLENTFGLGLFEHLVVDGADVGVRVNDTLLLRDSTMRDCVRGAAVVGGAHLDASGNLWAENATGLEVFAGSAAASGGERPNSFVGNAVGANLVSPGVADRLVARLNWWGAGDGPFSAISNPTGSGDEASLGVEIEPFLTAPPDLSDSTPVVRMVTRIHPVVEPGEKVFVEWSVSDDGALTGIDIQWFDPQALAFVDLVKGLHPGTRRAEIVVPEIGVQPNFPRMPLRIVAHDDAGQTGVEQFWLIVPAAKSAAPVQIQAPLGPLVGGEQITVCYDAPGIQSTASVEIRVETSADDRFGLKTNGTIGSAQCSFSPITIPHASTNRARFALRADGTGSLDEWYFSDWFTIRPDPRIGDAPPTVALTSPLDGQAFLSGEVIPIRWSSGDDIGLYEHRVQASLNGGRTFHTIAESLPPAARSFDWRLPISTGIEDLRVRVIAVDTLLQNTADGDERSLSILPVRRPSGGRLQSLTPPGGLAR